MPRRKAAPPPTPWVSLVTTLRATDDLPPALVEMLTEVPELADEAGHDLRRAVATDALVLAVKRSPSEWSGTVAPVAIRVTDEVLRGEVEFAVALDDADHADRLVATPPPPSV